MHKPNTLSRFRQPAWDRGIKGLLLSQGDYAGGRPRPRVNMTARPQTSCRAYSSSSRLHLDTYANVRYADWSRCTFSTHDATASRHDISEAKRHGCFSFRDKNGDSDCIRSALGVLAVCARFAAGVFHVTHVATLDAKVFLFRDSI